MTLTNIKNVLVIGAHPDDIEVGCAGFVAKCIHNGIRVNTAILSKCDNTSLDSEEGVREINLPKLHVTKTAGVETLF